MFFSFLIEVFSDERAFKPKYSGLSMNKIRTEFQFNEKKRKKYQEKPISFRKIDPSRVFNSLEYEKFPKLISFHNNSALARSFNVCFASQIWNKKRKRKKVSCNHASENSSFFSNLSFPQTKISPLDKYSDTQAL